VGSSPTEETPPTPPGFQLGEVIINPWSNWPTARSPIIPRPVNSNEEFIYARDMLLALGDEMMLLGSEMTTMGIEMGALGARFAFRAMEALGLEMEALGDVMEALGDEMMAWSMGIQAFVATHPISAAEARTIALEYAGLTSANSWSTSNDVVNDRLVWKISFWDSSRRGNFSWTNNQRHTIMVDAITGEATRIS